MSSLQNQIETVRNTFFELLQKASTQNELESVRVSFLGRKGKIADLMTIFKALPEDERRAFGPQMQALRDSLEKAFVVKEQAIILSQEKKEPKLDVTLSLYQSLRGKKHIYTQIIEELEDIFLTMGYEVVEGNEVETEYYNFSALNIPAEHPARAQMDTFFIAKPGMLLRTHTSAIQARIMEKRTPPIALFSTGRVFRNEETDATHDYMFMQAECIFIDTNVSISHLLATAQSFLRAIFRNDQLSIRVRPGYFPFVEPGLEIDLECPFCANGCSICKQSKWIELLGSGLIHPHVLKMSGIDPTLYSGFAFGMGIERLIMVRHNISDIRFFHSSKLSFLDQF